MNWVQSVNIFCLEMTVNTLHAQEMMSYPFSLSKYLKKKISSEQLYDSKQQRKYESLFCNEHTISQRQAPLLSISCCSFPYLKIDIKICISYECNGEFLVFEQSLGMLYSNSAAKSLQSCPTLCDPIDGSPPGSPVPGILQARTLEWVAISFSNA